MHNRDIESKDYKKFCVKYRFLFLVYIYIVLSLIIFFCTYSNLIIIYAVKDKSLFVPLWNGQWYIFLVKLIFLMKLPFQEIDMGKKRWWLLAQRNKCRYLLIYLQPCHCKWHHWTFINNTKFKLHLLSNFLSKKEIFILF